MSRVLIVEDEAHLANGLRFNLEAEGHSVEIAGDGERALSLMLAPSRGNKDETNKSENSTREDFDVVVLDVMLPGKDGFSVVSELRAARNYVPVLILTARGRPEDVLQGFAAGADDYLAKPFELPILLARLQGLLRRKIWMRESQAAGTPSHVPQGGLPHAHRPEANSESIAEDGIFSFDGRTIDFGKLELRTQANTIRLTLMEAELLRYLVGNRGRVVSRKSLLEEVWGLHEDTDTRAIDNFVVRLRRYIEDDPAEPRHLLTVRGVGYRFVAEPVPDAKNPV